MLAVGGGETAASQTYPTYGNSSAIQAAVIVSLPETNVQTDDVVSWQVGGCDLVPLAGIEGPTLVGSYLDWLEPNDSFVPLDPKNTRSDSF